MVFELLAIVSATILSSTTVFVVTGTYAQNMTVGNITGAENMTSESEGRIASENEGRIASENEGRIASENEGRIATESDDTGSISRRTREFPANNP